MKRLIQLLPIALLCLSIISCAKNDEEEAEVINNISFTAESDKTFYASYYIRAYGQSPGEYKRIEHRTDRLTLDENIAVVPGDSVYCQLLYNPTSTIKYQVKVGSRVQEAKTITPMANPPQGQSSSLEVRCFVPLR